MDKKNEFEELIECSICSEIFVQPKVLPCIHTFCLKCLISYSRDKEPRYVLPCPVCRKEFPIPASGLIALPNNYFVQKLLEIKDLSSEKSSSDGEKCDICNEGESIHYCFDCRQKMCDQCLVYHSKMRLNKGHKIINSRKVESPDKIMKMTSSFCQIHLEEPVKYYCVDCSIVICVSCYVEEHSTHKCSSISKEAETVRAQLMNNIKDVEGKSSMLEKLSNELKSYEDDLKGQVEKNMDKASERQALIERLCKKTYNIIKGEIEGFKKKKTKEFQEASELNQRHILMAQSYTSYASKVQQEATDADLLQCFKSLQTRAEELREIPTTTEYIPVNIEFCEKDDRLGEIRTVDQLIGSDTLRSYREHSSAEIHFGTQMIANQPEFCATFSDMLCFFSRSNSAIPSGQFNASPNILTLLVPQDKRGLLPGSHMTFTPIVVLGQQSFIQLTVYNCQNAACETKSAQIFVPPASVRLTSYSESASFLINYNFTNIQGHENYVYQMQVKVNIAADCHGCVKLTVTDFDIDHVSQNFKPLSGIHSLKLDGFITAVPAVIFSRHMGYIVASSTMYLVAQELIDLAAAVGCPYTDSVYLLDRKNCVVHKLDRSLKPVAQWKVDGTPEYMSIADTKTLLIACKTDNKIIEVDIMNGSPVREISLQPLSTPSVTAPANSTPVVQVGAVTMTKVFQCHAESFVAEIFQANGTKEIVIFNKDGQVVQQNIATGLQPLDIQVDRNGCVLVLANDSKIYVLGGWNYTDKLELIDLNNHQMTGANCFYLDSDFQRLIVGYKTGNLTIKMFQMKIDELRPSI